MEWVSHENEYNQKEMTHGILVSIVYYIKLSNNYIVYLKLINIVCQVYFNLKRKKKEKKQAIESQR